MTYQVISMIVAAGLENLNNDTSDSPYAVYSDRLQAVSVLEFNLISFTSPWRQGRHRL